LEEKSFENCENNLFNLIISIAEGKKTKSEYLDKRDLAIFKNGVTL